MADQHPPDPITELAQMAAQMAELFNAYVGAGIPPTHVAVMLGTWMAGVGGYGQQGNDGTD